VRLAFTIPGPPVPKARARVVTDKQGKTRGVTPAKTRDYEKHVKTFAWSARANFDAGEYRKSMRPDYAFTEPLQWPWQEKTTRYGLSVRVYRSRDAGDLGNYEKTIEDAMNGVIWPDDRRLHARGEGGIFACEKGSERVEVEVWTLD
jgi:Holliday junction resolvase RusA-like endonuclease